MDLEGQILQKSKEISTDAYAMSVGEMISLYKNGEIDIHPEFQRFFRWTSIQKSRLIESLLLGIPLPSIFVSQRSDGAWDVIDGLQRLSTILQLTGDLKDERGKQVDRLTLEKTRYLPDLAGKVWSKDQDEPDSVLPDSAKLLIKRARLDLKIVLNTSDPSAKYELFQRLNTGGSLATEQEVRNCILIMINHEFYKWLAGLGEDPNFRSCIPLTGKALEERYDLELIVRFLTLRTASEETVREIGDISPFLSDKIIEFAESKRYNTTLETQAFRNTFEILSQALGEDSFKKYDPLKNRSLGPLLISVFEVMAIGIGFHAHCKGSIPTTKKLKKIHHSLWENSEFLRVTGSGVRASLRLPVIIELGRELFAP